MSDAVSYSYFKSLLGRHSGKRGFVIGNGPSLRLDDLSRLAQHHEICIASNKIFLAFDRTLWRPDYFTVADILVWKKLRHDIHQHVDLVHLPDSFGLGDAHCQTRRWHYLGLAGEHGGSHADFSDDVTDGIYGGCSVTFDNLQLAVHLGLNPIYLIGCDHYYGGEEGTQRDIPIAAGNDCNHFLPNYREPGEMVNPAPLDLMERAYYHARRFADSHRIQIRNATRGGHLKVFERIDFETLW